MQLQRLRGHAGYPAKIVLGLAGMVCVVHGIWFTGRFYCPVAYWDFWNWVDYFHKIQDGRIGYLDFLNQHNEHRILTTRIVLYIDSLYFHMTGHFAGAVTVFLFALLGVLMHRLARGVVPTIFCVAAVMSLCQWPNLTQPFQVQFAFVQVFVVAAALALGAATAPATTIRKSAFMGVAAASSFTLACLSMAGGLLAGPPLLLMLWLRRARFWLVVLFTAPGALTTALYFRHFVRFPVSDGLPHVQGFARVWGLALFVLRFLGAALQSRSELVVPCGCILLVASVGMAIGLIGRRLRHPEPIALEAASLCAVAGFCGACAVAAAAGRFDLGPGAATEPRYSGISLLLLLTAGLYWWPLLYGALGAGRRTATRGAGALATGLALWLILATNFSAKYNDDAALLYSNLALDRAALRANVDDGAPFAAMTPVPLADLAPELRYLHDHRLNAFADDPAETRTDRALRGRDPRLLAACGGVIDSASALSPTRFLVTGALIDEAGARTADRVVAMTQAGDVLGSAVARLPRPIKRAKRHGPRTFGFRAGFAVPGGLAGVPIWLVGLFDGGAAPPCATPLPPLGNAMVQGLPPLSAATALPIAFTAPPTAPFALAAPPDAQLPPPWPGTPFLSTAAAGDAATGQLTYSVTWAAGAQGALLLPYATGPDPHGQSIVVTFRDGAALPVSLPDLPPQPRWRVVAIPEAVIAAHGGGTLRITARDGGAGWGQWLAAAHPMRGRIDPDHGRLY